MKIQIFDDKQKLGKAAARLASQTLQEAIAEKGQVFVIAATGASQFEFLDQLTVDPDIDWSKITFFHLDEYVGLSGDHPASFRHYLRERIDQKVHPGEFHYIDGNAEKLEAEINRLGELISKVQIDVAFVGVGENGHLAFNDPPADFETEEPFLLVQLDEACRRQQLGEGWFETFEDVPTHAISMSIREIMRAEKIICIVPDERKAMAIRNLLEGEVTPEVPCSILKTHPDTDLLLDKNSASLLSENTD
jgi:glucosamine-6-phosphate deaminase